MVRDFKVFKGGVDVFKNGIDDSYNESYRVAFILDDSDGAKEMQLNYRAEEGLTDEELINMIKLRYKE
tara:strand:+ start:767 stop:970 length:204 start_codon:yes stop_codon:yes gene_type:complete